MTPTRYSPEPIGSYRFAQLFRFLVEDPVAWDLAYLSWDFEAAEAPPDANFSTHVRRTLQYSLATGRLDLTGETPPSHTVRGMLRHPAPRAVKLLIEHRLVRELPLFQAYGPDWLRILEVRSHTYREPHDKDFDFEINVLTQAAEVIAKVR